MFKMMPRSGVGDDVVVDVIESEGGDGGDGINVGAVREPVKI